MEHITTITSCEKRFQSCIKSVRTRAFPGADVGSDHDILIIISRHALRNQGNQPSQESGLTSKS